MKKNQRSLSKVASLMMLTLTGSAYAAVQNPGFESGSTGWSLTGTTSINSSNAYSGSQALKLANKNADGTAEQVVTGLTPSTDYELHVFGKVDHNNTDLDIGVKNYGGADLEVSTSSQSYTELVISFTTGATDTSATISAQRLTGSKSAYVDDFSLVEVGGSGDTTPPTLAISSGASSPTTVSPIPVTMTFDEQVTGFDSSDLNITNGSMSNFSGNGTIWTMDVTPFSDGAVDVNVSAGSADDLAGNANLASNLFTIDYSSAPDTTAPTVSISSSESSPTSNTNIPVTISFSEAITGFDLSDLSVTNGSVSNLVPDGQNIIWTMDLTPAAEGNIDVSIATDSTEDLAGNGNEVSNVFTITYTSEPAVNLLVNGDFENRGTGWDTSWNGTVIRRGEVYQGTYSVRLGNEGNGQGGSAEQVITGLQPLSIYRLSAIGKVGDATAGTLNIGSKETGAPDVFVEIDTDSWQTVSMEFMTGETNTTAKIFGYRPHDQFTYGYADNFEVTYLRPAPQTAPDPIPSGPCLDPVTSSGNTTYYIDSTAGDDCASGTSQATAWSSLFRINATTFAAGDQILLKDDGVWTGILHPQGSGASGNHIVLSKYGNGGSEQRPIINGNGTLHAVYLYNQEYFEITNLEVINSAHPDAKKRGIEVENVDAGTLNQIHIINNYVHDIDGDNTKDTNGSAGIMVTVRKGETPVNSNYNGIYIEDNAVVRADRTAINTSSAWWCRPSVGCIDGSGYVAHSNVIVRNNYVEDAGGDGIVPINSAGALVEYNLVNGANINAQVHNVAIWTWNADHSLFQYNEAYNTQETFDGQGFDIDYGQDGTTFQYNYSHDNVGGFFLVATGDRNDSSTTNSVIRYNVSQNDQARLIHIGGRADGSEAYTTTPCT